MGADGRRQATGAGKAGLSPKFASLGPLLLARKGTAKPAMRAQLGDDARGSLAALEDFSGAADLTGQDDLGWNDMGEDALAAPIAEPEVKRQQSRLLSCIADANVAATQRSKVEAVQCARRAAFTLRLDEERHLRLRLASTMAGESAQNLVTRALDEFLARHPDIEHLAAQVRPRSPRGSGRPA
jgi:hypothetical protein